MNYLLFIAAGILTYSGLDYIGQIGKPREEPDRKVVVLTVALTAFLVVVLTLAGIRLT